MELESRRRFLVLAAALAGIRGRARSAGDQGGPARSDALNWREQQYVPMLAAAAERARRAGRPLLVMLEIHTYGSQRAKQWAAFLDLADDAACAELALCELVFTLAKVVRQRWPEAAFDDDAPPLGVLFEPDDARGVPIVVTARDPHREDLSDIERAARAKPWIDAVARALHSVIAPDDARFEVRARRMLGGDAGTGRAAERALARRCRAQLATTAPTGATWHEGFHVECGNGPCGMAAVPDSSRHFLQLYVDSQDGRK